MTKDKQEETNGAATLLPRIIASLDNIGTNTTRNTNDNTTNDKAEEDETKNNNADDYTAPQKKEKRHLILHFDINETILIGDEAGGDTVADCLNKIIAKNTFVQIPSNDIQISNNTHDYDNNMKPLSIESTKLIVPTHFWNGTPISKAAQCESSVPPLYVGWEWPPNTCPYYRTSFKKKAKTFTNTDQDGYMYRKLYEKLKDSASSNLMEVHSTSTSGTIQTSSTTSTSKLPKSHAFYNMIPSFFCTLVKLQEEQRDYTLVLRTFGTDLEDIANAISDFAIGKHPLFPHFREPKLVIGKDRLYKGRWRKAQDSNIEGSHDSSHIFDLYSSDRKDDDKTRYPIASGDDEVLKIIQQSSVCGIQDDYTHWDKNNNAPWSGKPVWITTTNEQKKKDDIQLNPHHLFFDDNIHNDANDSIVAVRQLNENNSWVSLSGLETIAQQGRYIVRVPTVSAMLDQNWFYNKIMAAEKEVERP
mmetsp:Transcript_6807/g.7725  ORF Transcript_6807/g.7725 Transcript_6807/m.7725 type:complete len:473 (-) Transcript_6807:113-1531(-)